MLKERELKKLRKALPKNGYQLIAEKSGYEKSMVGRVLRGERHNEKIIEKAFEVIEEYKQKIAELKAKVNHITKI